MLLVGSESIMEISVDGYAASCLESQNEYSG